MKELINPEACPSRMIMARLEQGVRRYPVEEVERYIKIMKSRNVNVSKYEDELRERVEHEAEHPETVNLLKRAMDAYYRLLVREDEEVQHFLEEVTGGVAELEELRDDQLFAIVNYETNGPTVVWETKEEVQKSKQIQKIMEKNEKKAAKTRQPDKPLKKNATTKAPGTSTSDTLAVEQVEPQFPPMDSSVYNGPSEVLLGKELGSLPEVIEVKAEEEPLEVKMNSPRPGTKAEAALAMLRKGKTQKEIAAELGVSLGFIYKLGKRYL